MTLAVVLGLLNLAFLAALAYAEGWRMAIYVACLIVVGTAVSMALALLVVGPLIFGDFWVVP